MWLTAGQVIQFGLAQLPGAVYSGSPALTASFNGNPVNVDDNGIGAPSVYTALSDGSFSIAEGCQGKNNYYDCSGTVVWDIINTITIPPPPPYQTTALSGTCQQGTSNGFTYQACFAQSSDTVTVSQVNSDGTKTKIGSGDYNFATNSATLSNGEVCGSPWTPRQGKLRLSCGGSSSATVSESSLYRGSQVVCQNCCNCACPRYGYRVVASLC